MFEMFTSKPSGLKVIRECLDQSRGVTTPDVLKHEDGRLLVAAVPIPLTSDEGLGRRAT